jgi:hypothetical protein
MSTGAVPSEPQRAHRFAFSRSESMWEHLQESVWLFGVGKFFGYDCQTILHFADGRTGRTREINIVVSVTHSQAQAYTILIHRLIMIVLAYGSAEGSTLCL